MWIGSLLYHIWWDHIGLLTCWTYGWKKKQVIWRHHLGINGKHFSKFSDVCCSPQPTEEHHCRQCMFNEKCWNVNTSYVPTLRWFMFTFLFYVVARLHKKTLGCGQETVLYFVLSLHSRLDIWLLFKKEKKGLTSGNYGSPIGPCSHTNKSLFSRDNDISNLRSWENKRIV